MAVLIADTSGLVSLGIVTDGDSRPLDVTVGTYDVIVPTAVMEELEAVASYDDRHGESARRVLDRTDSIEGRAVELDSEFPLDDGENAAVTLANDTDADILLCDEFNQLGLIHASLANTRLVTTPTLLAVLVKQGRIEAERARTILDEIGAVRSWEGNTYVGRARTLLEED